MRFEISSYNPLAGRTTLPGDLNLTLSVMALAMISPEPITIVNPSPSPDIDNFRIFLEQNGATFHNTPEGFTITGTPWDKDIIIDDEVPDAVLHLVISGTVFSGHSVRVATRTAERISVIRYLCNVLKTMGLTDEHITEDGNDVIIRGTPCVPNTVVTVRSAQAFEAVSAAALAARTAAIVSFPPQVVSHSERLLELMGYQSTTPENVRVREAELARRMAKAAGEPPPEMRRFEYTGNIQTAILIPGDTTLAAAVAGAASVLQRSDVVLEGVLWEPGRRGFFDALRRMKGDIKTEQVHEKNSFDSADIRIRWSNLDGILLSSGQALTMRSELMILGAVASFARGETVISDIAESPGLGRDAFTAIARGLEMLGTHVGDYADGIVLMGGNELRGDLVDSVGRPDIALALSLAGLNAAGTTTIFGFEAERYPVGEFRRIVKELSSEISLSDR